MYYPDPKRRRFLTPNPANWGGITLNENSPFCKDLLFAGISIRGHLYNAITGNLFSDAGTNTLAPIARPPLDLQGVDVNLSASTGAQEGNSNDRLLLDKLSGVTGGLQSAIWLYPISNAGAFENYFQTHDWVDTQASFYGLNIQVGAATSTDLWTSYGDGTGSASGDRRSFTYTSALLNNAWGLYSMRMITSTTGRLWRNGLDWGAPSSTSGTGGAFAINTGTPPKIGSKTANQTHRCGIAAVFVWGRNLTDSEEYALYNPQTRWSMFRPSGKTFYDTAAPTGDNQAQLTGAIPAITGSFTGTMAANQAQLSGAMPAVTGSFTGTNPVGDNNAQLTGAIPAITGSFTGTMAANQAQLTGIMGAITGQFFETVPGIPTDFVTLDIQPDTVTLDLQPDTVTLDIQPDTVTLDV